MTVLWHDMQFDADAQMRKLDTLRNELQPELIVSMIGKMDLLGIRNSEGFQTLRADIKALTEAVLNKAGSTGTLAPEGSAIHIHAPAPHFTPHGPQAVVGTVAGSREERERAVLKHLNASPYRDRKDRNPCRVPGTCEWFVSHKLFRDWRDSKSSRMLWVSADPGCGKSVLVRHLVESVLHTSNSRTVCYFFFKDDFADQRSVVGALSCILHQLFVRRRSLLSEAILDRLDTKGRGATNISFADLWQTLVEVAQVESAGEIICLLDAIDECEDQGWSQLSQALRLLYSRTDITTGFNLKFLLTSRPYDSIRISFRPLILPSLPVIHLSGESEVEIEKITKEIDAVIRARVRDIGEERHLTQGQEISLLKMLTCVPNRTYLWVYLTLDLVEKSIATDKARIQEATARLPRTVDEAYEKILHKSSDPKAAKKLLHIIVAAARPLTLAEMNVALALNQTHQSYDDLKPDLRREDRLHHDIRGICGLFVTIIDTKVYLLHQTAKEFLVRSSANPLRGMRAGLKWKYSLQPQDSHHVLAKACIQHLLFTEFESFQSFENADAPIFLEYSAKHWAAHVRELPSKLQDELAESMRKLCDANSSRCLTWLKVYWESTGSQFPQEFTALMVAAYFGLKTVVKHLLGTPDINLNSQDGTYGRSALSWAAGNGHSTVVGLLTKGAGIDLRWLGVPLQSRARVDLVDIKGRSPLTYAVWNGNLAAVRLLMKEGARVDLEDGIGGTPLFYAVFSGPRNVAKLLLSGKKTKPSDEGDMVARLLFSAVEKGDGAAVVLLLETGKVSTQVKNGEGRTPLSWAVKKGNENMVKLLLDKGADPNPGGEGRTPLSWAVEKGNENMVRLLLAKGANINAQDHHGVSALHTAVQAMQKNTMSLLLEHEANIEAKDKEDRTALCLAVEVGFKVGIEMLVAKGAEVNIRYELVSWLTLNMFLFFT